MASQPVSQSASQSTVVFERDSHPAFAFALVDAILGVRS